MAPVASSATQEHLERSTTHHTVNLELFQNM
jgi:hypothetical protein